MAPRYKRDGEVTATVLTETRTWTNQAGDRLVSSPGDYWVVDADGDERGVAAERFDHLYEATPAPGHYRRRGTVAARQVIETETIATREGPTIAEPGMWVLTDDHGDAWPVTDAYFAQHYRKADAHSQGTGS